MIERVVLLAATVVEVLGVSVIVIGAAVALVTVLLGRRAPDTPSIYTAYRRALGRAILLGLEFLVAADIIRTVSSVPTLDQVVVLAIIVLIRTFLSFTLEVELEGGWPWQRPRRTESVK